MPTTINDVLAAVQGVNNVLKNPSASQKDLDRAAELEQETITAYLQESHAGAQAEAQLEAG